MILGFTGRREISDMDNFLLIAEKFLSEMNVTTLLQGGASTVNG